jgi:AraC-like DNA-binding protein
MLNYTVSADLIDGVIDCAKRCGVPRAAALRRTSTDRGKAAPTRFSGQHLAWVWERINRQSDDPLIGFHMALIAEPKSFGALGQVLLRCATVHEAFRQAARYATLVYQGAHLKVSRDAESLKVFVAPDIPGGQVGFTLMIWLLTNIALLPGRLALADTIVPKLVRCKLPAPQPAALRTLRERLPFQFDAAVNQIEFDRAVGDLRVASADQALHELLAQVMEQQLTNLGPSGELDRGLKLILRGMINGTMPTLAALSAHTGLSTRTLQRRLRETGTSFAHLLQEVLREKADELISRGTLSQGEIAFMLGYSEVSAFSRAYRSWTGRPPGAAKA